MKVKVASLSNSGMLNGKEMRYMGISKLSETQKDVMITILQNINDCV